MGTDGSAAVAVATLMAAGGGGIPGPSGRSTEDDLQLAMALGASLKETDGADGEPMEVEGEEVPLEPEAGEGVRFAVYVSFGMYKWGGLGAANSAAYDSLLFLEVLFLVYILALGLCMTDCVIHAGKYFSSSRS